MRKRIGGCNCGQVKFEVSGEPLRVGFCHCQVCRKETGSLGNFFAVWPSDKVSVAGATRSWRRATDNRHFCSTWATGPADKQWPYALPSSAHPCIALEGFVEQRCVGIARPCAGDEERNK